VTRHPVDSQSIHLQHVYIASTNKHARRAALCCTSFSTNDFTDFSRVNSSQHNNSVTMTTQHCSGHLPCLCDEKFRVYVSRYKHNNRRAAYVTAMRCCVSRPRHNSAQQLLTLYKVKRNTALPICTFNEPVRPITFDLSSRR